MKQYIKDNEIKSRNEIIVRRNGMQTICPSEDLLLADGWVEYIETKPTKEELDKGKKQQEALRLRSSLSDTDYKIIKCMEAYLCGEELPYDIEALHAERNTQRDEINKLER